MQPVTQRYGPMQRVDAPTNRRWVYPSDYDLPQLFDNFDKLRLLIDPKGKFVMNAHNAANRQFDDLIIAALGGTAQTGVSGTTAVTFPSSQIVSVQQGATAPTGLTVAKLRQAKLILMQNEAYSDEEEDPGDPNSGLVCVAGARQLDNLMAEAQVDQPRLQRSAGARGRPREAIPGHRVHPLRAAADRHRRSGRNEHEGVHVAARGHALRYLERHHNQHQPAP